MHLQSSLGRWRKNYRPDLNMSTLSLAKVIKVYHKYSTADVALLPLGTKTAGGGDGKLSARILQPFANYDPSRNKFWGSVTPISVGATVVVAFLDGLKNRPIILGQLHSDNQFHNVLPDENMLEDEPGDNRREAFKSLTVYPSQAYKKVDGEGNIEFVTASKSFLAIYNEFKDEDPDGPVNTYLNDDHLGFDHENLSETELLSGKVLSTDIEEAKTPSAFLYVHRTQFDNTKTTWTKVYMSRDGLFRVTRDNRDDHLSYLELSEKGETKLRRQVDSPMHGEGENFSEITQKENGDIVLRRQTEKDKYVDVIVGKDAEVEIKHSSGSSLKMHKDFELEVEGEVFSTSLNKFVQKHHIVVSKEEPKEAQPGCFWIDTSDL